MSYIYNNCIEYIRYKLSNIDTYNVSIINSFEFNEFHLQVKELKKYYNTLWSNFENHNYFLREFIIFFISHSLTMDISSASVYKKLDDYYIKSHGIDTIFFNTTLPVIINRICLIIKKIIFIHDL